MGNKFRCCVSHAPSQEQLSDRKDQMILKYVEQYCTLLKIHDWVQQFGGLGTAFFSVLATSTEQPRPIAEALEFSIGSQRYLFWITHMYICLITSYTNQSYTVAHYHFFPHVYTSHLHATCRLLAEVNTLSSDESQLRWQPYFHSLVPLFLHCEEVG